MEATEILTMSTRELGRLEILGRVAEKRLTQREAALRLGLGVRQIARLVVALREQGPPGLISGRRGRPSNRTLPDAVRDHAVGLVRSLYAGFGPTLALEKLVEHHGVEVSVETLRHWMIDEGLWEPRSRRPRRAHQPRQRRPCRGELVQIDGCEHAWFEQRGPTCTLLVYGAYSGDRDQSFRSIVIACSGDRDRSGATLGLVSVGDGGLLSSGGSL